MTPILVRSTLKWYIRQWYVVASATLWPVRLAQLVSPILHVVHPMLSFVWMVRMSVVRRGAGRLYRAPLVCFFACHYYHHMRLLSCSILCLDLLRQTSKQHLLYMYNQNIVGWAWASIGDTIPLSVSLKLSLTSGLCLCHSNSVLLVVIKLVVKFIRSGHRI